MKATCLLFLTISCAALMPETAYAGSSNPAFQQSSSESAPNLVNDHPQDAGHATLADGGTRLGKASDDQQNHRKISGNKLPTNNPRLSKSNRPNEVPSRRERSAAEDSKNSHRPGSDKSGGAAKNGLIRNETVNHAASNRGPSTARPSVPSLGNVRHRGPNPAIIGGAGSSNTRNTAALDGTHMNRKRTGN
jgi:hypothetical protein